MERIVIQANDRRKTRALLDFLASLDFVETVSKADLPTTEDIEQSQKDDFFALAGLWAGRDINLESIRQQAWP